jgi:internalin A
LFLGPDLRDLSLIDAGLEEIPPALRDFVQMRELNFSGNPIRALPEWIGNLKDLITLWLANCELPRIPEVVSSLRKLEALSLHANQVTAVPRDFGQLTQLDTLVLSANPLDRVPAEVFDLPNLVKLGLSCEEYTKRKGTLTEIPADILRLQQLVELDVEGQPITTPPAEVVANGLSAIRDYYRQIQDAGLDYLCEAKLLVLGEPGAGKTTLTRKLKNAEYELRSDQPSTEGIDVLQWRFPIELVVNDAGRMQRLKADFGVHLWDFGGQEIYHATHQFFLTKRSLYVLVADSRAEDTDFNYWLNAVELLSDGSPLLIVQNEKQDRRRDLDEAKLRGRFANLREVLRTNLSSGRGLVELTRAVCRELEALPHIGTPLPKTWKRVRESLKGDARNHIPLQEFFGICEDAGFTRDEDKLQLSGFLHDLGICLHFQDDPLLRRTVILKPEWGTDAVYRVLDDPGVQERHGRFERKHLGKIWSDAKHAAMCDELLQLMMKFGLCYRIPGSESFIAPQLLRAARAQYSWDLRDNLIVEFRYEFMPKGILTRFIVVLHGLIADQNLVWKSGVVLTKDGARAEVIEDYSQRVISVRVAGPNRKDLLTIVDWELERIHASFPLLKYAKRIPCNCAHCAGQERPHFYDFEIVRQFASDRQPQIQCQKSYSMVDVQALIDNVFAATRPTLRPDPEHLAGAPSDKVEAPDAAPRKELFVSYAWEPESEKLVDAIAEGVGARGVTLLRDKSELSYKDPIRVFMQRIGKGKCVAVVVSRKFLQSHYCMYELVEIAAAGDFSDRIFPIILEDAQIFDVKSRLGYIRYWEGKITELNEEMKAVGQDNLQGIREEIDLYVQIRATMAKLMDILAGMNTLSPEAHRRAGFAAFFDKIQAKLAE